MWPPRYVVLSVKRLSSSLGKHTFEPAGKQECAWVFPGVDDASVSDCQSWRMPIAPQLQSCTGKATANPLSPWPQVRQEHPLNLSILLSGGKETNQDSPSSGERSGKSPTCKSGTCPRIVVYRSALRSGPGPSSLERDVREGENPVDPGACCPTRRCPRVGLLGSAALIGW